MILESFQNHSRFLQTSRTFKNRKPVRGFLQDVRFHNNPPTGSHFQEDLRKISTHVKNS